MPHRCGVFKPVVLRAPQRLRWPPTQVNIVRVDPLGLPDELEADKAQEDERKGDVGRKEVGDGKLADEDGEAVKNQNEGEEEDAHPGEVRLEP